LQNFNSDALFEFSVGPLGQIHQAHSAPPNDGQHPVGPESLAGGEHKDLQCRRRFLRNRALQKSLGTAIMSEQQLYLPAQIGIATVLGQELFPLGCRQACGLLE